MGISPIFDTHYPQFFTSLAQKKIPASIIITEHIFKIIKNDYTKELRTFLNLDNARLYTIKEAGIAFIVTDTFTAFSLRHRTGEFDALMSLMSFEPSAIKWGEELFEYYRGKSIEINS
jgi:predicted transcriptional regulator